MGSVLTGTCSWTDKTLLESGWYSDKAKTAESRLVEYASRFPVVEVDSTYYSLPSERTAELWSERTPATFTFDIKAFRLLTGHPTEPKTLPKDLRAQVAKETHEKAKVYLQDLSPESTNEIWEIFRQGLMPLHSAGKLGVILFQFPPWFLPGRDSKKYLTELPEKVPDYDVAIEFRHGSWLNENNEARTIDFLREHRLAYVSVDEPQGTRQSVPPVATATAEVAVVRFHGRRAETWDKANVGVLERFRYLYDEEQLKEWVPKVRELAEQTREVHALMNNCYSDYAVRNASQLATLLETE
jgi:uncharacterized protein YecE (DUF72 family)